MQFATRCSVARNRKLLQFAIRLSSEYNFIEYGNCQYLSFDFWLNYYRWTHFAFDNHIARRHRTVWLTILKSYSWSTIESIYFSYFFVSMSNSEWWWWYFGLLRCCDLLSHSQFDKNSINISCTFCCCSSVMSTRSMYRVAQRQNQAIALSAHVNCKKVRRCRKENSLAFQPKANILYSQMHRGIHCADRSFRVILQVFVRQMKISNVVRLTAKLRNR